MANTTLTAASVPLRTNPESWVPLGLHLSNVPQSYPYRCLTAPYGASVTLTPNPDTSVQFAYIGQKGLLPYPVARSNLLRCNEKNGWDGWCIGLAIRHNTIDGDDNSPIYTVK